MRKIHFFLIPLFLMGCQTSDEYAIWRPAKDIGESVNKPFDDMIAAAWRADHVIGEVYFEYDKDELTSKSKTKLQEMVSTINQRTGQVMIAGHADHNNTDEYNKKLGYKRAIQVADYLKSAGVWEERMLIRSFGETRPSDTNWTDDGQAQNRRVIVSMYDQGDGMTGSEATRVYERYKSRGEESDQSQSSVDIPGLGGGESGD